MSTLEASNPGGALSEDAASGRSVTFGRIIRNIVAVASSQVVTLTLSATVAILLPRFLGDVNLGKLAFAGAYTQLFAVVTSLGAGIYVTKEVARDSSRTISYATNAALMRLPLVIVMAALGILLVNVIGYDSTTKTVVYILFVGVWITSIYDIVSSSLQGLQEMRLVALAQVAGVVVSAVTVIALLLNGQGVIAIALAYLLGMVTGLIVASFFLTRRTGAQLKQLPAISLDRKLWSTIFFGGLPFFIWQVSLLIYGEVDRVMLSLMTHDAVVGWYEAAYRLVSAPTFIPVIVMTVVFPALAASANRDRHEFNTIVRRGIQVVLLATVPIATGVFVLSSQILSFLGYPPVFSHSVPLMMILSIHIPIMSMDMIIGTALNAADRQRVWAATGVAAALLNPTLNAILIPVTQAEWGNGAIGSASATVATEVFMMFMGLRLLPRGVLDRATFSTALRTLASAAVMAAVVWFARDLFILIPVALGAVTYTGCAFALRVVHVNDLRTLRSYVLERQRARAAAPGLEAEAGG